jgi:hypothetical protein
VGELEGKTPVAVLQGRTRGGGSSHRCIAAAEGFKFTLAYASTCASSNAAGGEWGVTGDSGNMLGGGVSTEDGVDSAGVEWILEFGRANDHWALMKVAPRGAIRTCLGFKGGKTQCVRGAEGSAQAQHRCASHDGAHRIACGRSKAGQTAIRVIKDNNIDEATVAELGEGDELSWYEDCGCVSDVITSTQKIDCVMGDSLQVDVVRVCPWCRCRRREKCWSWVPAGCIGHRHKQRESSGMSLIQGSAIRPRR